MSKKKEIDITEKSAWRQRVCPVCGDIYTSRALLCLKHWINWMCGTLSVDDRIKYDKWVADRRPEYDAPAEEKGD